MKTFLTLALTLVLTASLFVGCGCTNQKMDGNNPTVLPTNEEIWDTTETTKYTTESTTSTTGTIVTETTEETRNINETEIKNGVNAHTEMMEKIREKEKAEKEKKKAEKEANAATGIAESPSSRMMPKNR